MFIEHYHYCRCWECIYDFCLFVCFGFCFDFCFCFVCVCYFFCFVLFCIFWFLFFIVVVFCLLFVCFFILFYFGFYFLIFGLSYSSSRHFPSVFYFFIPIVVTSYKHCVNISVGYSSVLGVVGWVMGNVFTWWGPC